MRMWVGGRCSHIHIACEYKYKCYLCAVLRPPEIAVASRRCRSSSSASSLQHCAGTGAATGSARLGLAHMRIKGNQSYTFSTLARCAAAAADGVEEIYFGGGVGTCGVFRNANRAGTASPTTTSCVCNLADIGPGRCVSVCSVYVCGLFDGFRQRCTHAIDG